MAESSSNASLNHEDALRVGTYGVLGALMAGPPARDLLDRLATAGGDEGSDAIGKAWSAVALAAQRADPAAVRQEYNDLFIGVAQGEITPYASWYLTGSLMERPLVELRQSLKALGVERHRGVKEPEDHAGAVLETMALLINADDVSFDREQAFFQAHLEPWLKDCFTDVQEAASAAFYRPVGLLGAEFMDLESKYYRMPV